MLSMSGEDGYKYKSNMDSNYVQTNEYAYEVDNYFQNWDWVFKFFTSFTHGIVLEEDKRYVLHRKKKWTSPKGT